MVLNSLPFAGCFLLFMAVLLILPKKARWYWLLAADILFYLTWERIGLLWLLLRGNLLLRWGVEVTEAHQDEHDEQHSYYCVLIHYLRLVIYFWGLTFYYFPLATLTKFMKRGCGCSTVLLYSGWNCVPTYQRCFGTSTISTRSL